MATKSFSQKTKITKLLAKLVVLAEQPASREKPAALADEETQPADYVPPRHRRNAQAAQLLNRFLETFLRVSDSSLQIRCLLLLHRSPLASGRRAICSITYTRVNERQLVTRRGTYMLFAAFLLMAAFAAGTATAATGDPRVCATLTPGGTSRHAYWCAHNAAVAAVRTTMQHSQHVARWLPGVSCDQAGTLLRWRCFTFLGGDHWNLNVVFRATSAGWKRTVTVAP